MRQKSRAIAAQFAPNLHGWTHARTHARNPPKFLFANMVKYSTPIFKQNAYDRTFQHGKGCDESLIADIRRVHAGEIVQSPQTAITNTSKRARVSRGTVNRYIQQEKPAETQSGRPQQITEDIIQYIDHVLSHRPAILLDEIVQESRLNLTCAGCNNWTCRTRALLITVYQTFGIANRLS